MHFELFARSAPEERSLLYFHALRGQRTEASTILKEIEAQYAQQKASGQDLAAVYAGFGDKDQAFHWLEKDFEQKEILLPEIIWGFAFEGLRKDSRYDDLVRRMGLTP